jgi:hypothetical protein
LKFKNFDILKFESLKVFVICGYCANMDQFEDSFLLGFFLYDVNSKFTQSLLWYSIQQMPQLLINDIALKVSCSKIVMTFVTLYDYKISSFIGK